MFSLPKTFIFLSVLMISVSAYTVPATVPQSVRELLNTGHQFHPSVDAQLEVAEQRLKLLNRELTRQKARRKLLTASLRSSLINSDLRLEESRNACNAVRNYNRSVIECNRLPVVEENAERRAKRCEKAQDVSSCFADRLVRFEILKAIFQIRCSEVKKQKMTIATTKMICGELRKRVKKRMVIKTSKNPVVMELEGVLIGLNFLLKEIKMVIEQIENFTPPMTPTPDVEISPYYVVDI